MLVSNNEFRPRPAAVPKRGGDELWRRQLQAVERERERVAAKALSDEQKAAELKAKVGPLMRDAGRDLRALHELGMQSSGIDPRWAKQLHDRAAKAVAELVRLADESDVELEVGDAIVLAAMERLLLRRAAAAREFFDGE